MFRRKKKFSKSKENIEVSSKDWLDDDAENTYLIPFDAATLSSGSVKMYDEDEDKLARRFEECMKEKEKDITQKKKEIKRLNCLLDQKQELVEHVMVELSKRGMSIQSLEDLPYLLDKVNKEISELKSATETYKSNNIVDDETFSFENEPGFAKIRIHELEEGIQECEKRERKNQILSYKSADECSYSDPLKSSKPDVENKCAVSIENLDENETCITTVSHLENSDNGGLLKFTDSNTEAKLDISNEHSRAYNDEIINLGKPERDCTVDVESSQSNERSRKSIMGSLFGRLFCFY